ncbi:MAG TPA: hypothetical protein VIV11_13675, partial [Kofleriaceae bacterium]
MGYDARRDELLRELANIQVPSELSQDHLTQRRLDTVEKPAFTRAIETWGTERRQLFEDLVKLVEDTSAVKIQERAWFDRVQRCIDAYSSSIGGVMSQVGTPTVMAIAFAAHTSRIEREFLDLLHTARAVAACRDAAAQYRELVAQRASALEKVWNEIKTTHADFDKQEQDIYAEIAKMLDEAAEKAAVEHASRKEKAVGWAATIGQFGAQLLSIPDSFVEGAKNASEIYLAMQLALSGRTKL